MLHLHLNPRVLFAVQIKSGMSFRNFYSSSLCAISRAALLTGRDAVRTGNLFNR
jgi:arylsulfatase A-like enzyme